MFFNYKNFPNSKITVHIGECNFCNNGQGVQREILNGANGGWSAPFLSYELVLANANEILLNEFPNGGEISDCGICNPQ